MQDNSPVHNSYVVQTEARSGGYESFLTLLTLPTLHHLTSIFPTMKSSVKGKRFSFDESLFSEVKAWLHAQSAQFYGRGLHITLAEAYIEKDK